MTAFKIGSVYRDEAGYLIALANPSEHGYRWPNNVALAIKIEEGGAHYGSRRLSDGVCSVDENPCYRLIPGELHQVNGEWVSVEQMSGVLDDFPSFRGFEQLIYRPAERCCPSCYAPEGCTHELSCAFLLPMKAEPKRPPLDWNKPTPFDPFPGFHVRSFHNWEVGEEAAHNQGPLQRLADSSNPLHGSAYLKR